MKCSQSLRRARKNRKHSEAQRSDRLVSSPHELGNSAHINVDGSVNTALCDQCSKFTVCNTQTAIKRDHACPRSELMCVVRFYERICVPEDSRTISILRERC
jgi:hypothetical protein